MKSSYKQNNYASVFKAVCYFVKPKKVVEFGILEAYSLKAFIDSCPSTTKIEAHDIFEEFPYNSANFDKITEKFSVYSNVSIHRSDFYGAEEKFKNEEIDILHIDIANNGDVFEYTFEKYMSKVSQEGVCILEGGSSERDQVEWMTKFKKPQILPIIEKHKNEYDIVTLEDYPSITMIRHLRKK